MNVMCKTLEKQKKINLRRKNGKKKQQKCGSNVEVMDTMYTKLEKRKEWHEPQKKSGERKKKNVEAMW